MPQRAPLSPLTNGGGTPRRPPQSKYVSPSTSKTLGLCSPTPKLTNFVDHDEGKQRKELRRRSQVIDLHRKNFGSPGGSPRSTDALNGLTSTQLANHYSDCIKLSTENKINAKNAFGLHLIDFMAEYVKKEELENFQVASSTLDASVKIYAGRVDFIHGHAYKVLGGLGGGQQKGNAQDDLDGEGEIEGLENQPKKKKKVGKTRTIETNMKNINMDKFDLEFDVDPMFQVMSAAFDEGGAQGLLLNRLHCFDDDQGLVLDSSTDVNIVEDQCSEGNRKGLDVGSLKELLSNLQLEETSICPSLADFNFTEWNEETSTVQRFSDFAFDPLAEPINLPNVEEEIEAIAHEEMEDIDDAGGDLDCDSVAAEPDAIAGGDSRTAEFVESALSDFSQGSVGKLRQILALEPSDYTYFNKVLFRTWAGPAHWRAGPASKQAILQKGEVRKPKRQKKAPMRLTYDSKIEELDKCFKPSKTTAVTKATWSKYSKDKTTLPQDQHLDSQDYLFRLFHKPKLMIKRQLGDSIGLDDDIDNYNYNNKNDVENFCPEIRDGDDDFSSGGFDLSNDTQFVMSQDNMSAGSLGLNTILEGTVLTQDKLVAAPHRVERIDIQYAKSAKRVDVRKLKSTMWKILTDSQVPNDSTPEVPSMMMNAHSFSELKENLPTQVTSTMARNLSIQNVFACLLYLTNEKTLKLTCKEDMSDINIQQDLL